MSRDFDFLSLSEKIILDSFIFVCANSYTKLELGQASPPPSRFYCPLFRNVKILTHFYIEIWFFDTQNTSYLIVRGLKKCIFHILYASVLPLTDYFVTEHQQTV